MLPTPAIVAQDAARRLPRWPLMWLTAAYVVAGYVGRQPWKSADIIAFDHMLALQQAAAGSSIWWQPLDGALLPYWLGAWAIAGLQPLGLDAALAVRLPFMLLLAGTLLATWQAVYNLCREPGAQPLAFAFGGEARPADYARALADGGLLALMATLGLAQFSHETTPTLAQLFFTALSFYGLAALPHRPRRAALGLLLALPGLSLSGAPLMALALALLGGLGLPLRMGQARWTARALLLALGAGSLGLALWLSLLPSASAAWATAPSRHPSGLRLLIWFTWPSWPLALWTLWRWRRQLLQRHLGLPLLMAGLPLLAAALTPATDRSLLLALPGLAALAALALPTFSRTASALIDWFTLLFFTGWAVVIWVVWVSLQTGVPAKPAANVARLAPGFEPVFQWPAFVAALLGTLAWVALVRWRTGRHRTAIWKSLVLPAAGTTLCWLLLMTLWLPALDYGRSYAPQMQLVRSVIGQGSPCLHTRELSAAQMAALRVHGHWHIAPESSPATAPSACPWLITDARTPAPASGWALQALAPRPADRDEALLIYRRAPLP